MCACVCVCVCAAQWCRWLISFRSSCNQGRRCLFFVPPKQLPNSKEAASRARVCVCVCLWKQKKVSFVVHLCSGVLGANGSFHGSGARANRESARTSRVCVCMCSRVCACVCRGPKTGVASLVGAERLWWRSVNKRQWNTPHHCHLSTNPSSLLVPFWTTVPRNRPAP